MKLKNNEQFIKKYYLLKHLISFFGITSKNVEATVTSKRLMIESREKKLLGKVKDIKEVDLQDISTFNVFISKGKFLPLLILGIVFSIISLVMLITLLDYESGFMALSFILFLGLAILFFIMFAKMPKCTVKIVIGSKRHNSPVLHVSAALRFLGGSFSYSNVKTINDPVNGFDAFVDEMGLYLNNNESSTTVDENNFSFSSDDIPTL